MTKTFIAELQELGLSAPEAQVYTALLNNGALGAAAVAQRAGIQRTNVYGVLSSLADKGMVETGSGYGSKFIAVLPDEGLRLLIARERETLAAKEQLAAQLAELMAPFVSPTEAASEELIQVIRSPKVVAERVERLQLEAERLIEVFCKPPFFQKSGNPAEDKTLRRGVRNRALYEKAALEESAVKPYLSNWLAEGEEARVYDGELTHKLVIFDSKIALIPLIMPGQQMKAVLIHHPQLVQTLSLAFQFIWDRSEPIADAEQKKPASSKSPITVRGKRDRNHQPSRA